MSFGSEFLGLSYGPAIVSSVLGNTGFHSKGTGFHHVGSAESSDVGYSQDLFDDSKQSVADAQQRAEEYAEQANVANREFYDYSYRKSEEAAENAYKRQVRWLEDYYPSLLKSIRDAGLNPNLVLSGGGSVSAPSAAVASGDTLNMNKAQLVYDNVYMQLLKQQMTDSNKILTTSISALSNVLGKLIPKL